MRLERGPVTAADVFRIKIMDRYMTTELAGPFLFGLSAFTLIFIATQILAISRLVSDNHAPLWAAVEYFLWTLPSIVVLVIPMAMLLGVLLALQRLSAESEITAMKAGGISMTRVVAPMLAMGFLASLVSLVLQEGFVPFANDRAAYIRDQVIKHIDVTNGSPTVVSPLPGGGRQLTSATAFEGSTQSLLNVTLIQYNRAGDPEEIVFSRRAHYEQPTWTFDDATVYRFDGGTIYQSIEPRMRVDIGEKPSQLLQRLGSPQEMSRKQIADAIKFAQLSSVQLGSYLAEYHSKLARPFACFVFALIAVPFGLSAPRGGGAGGTSVGFGLAVAIVFVYYVISTIFLSLGAASPSFAFVSAWMPNIIFTCIGLLLLRRAAAV